MTEQTLEGVEQAQSPDGAETEQAAPKQDTPARKSPVAESIKYRRRAQQAEGRLQQYEQELEESRASLARRAEELASAEAQRDEAMQQLTASQNRLAAQRLLGEAGVVDIEAASLLLSKRIDLGGEVSADQIGRGVEELLLDKPYLLESAATLPPSTASARDASAGVTARLARAAEQAAKTGGRRQVAEYLRLRRQASER